MLFTQNSFLLLFLPLCWAAYAYLVQHRASRVLIWLIALASVVFYAYDSLRNAGIMLTSIAINYTIARLMRAEAGETPRRKQLLFAGIALNLLLLCSFKYTGFLLENLAWVSGSTWSIPKIALPLGISFYTFTQIAYLVDSYKRHDVDQDSGVFLLFVTFFPHLVAGPIIHHREMMPQFRRLGTHDIHWRLVTTGLFLFAIGLFKKVLIADTFAPWVDAGYADTSRLGTVDAWLLSLGYSFQLYFDFSGYADMAVGIGMLFGIFLPFNFNAPYKAQSIQDFWRRWHITLSRWLRNYLYIPLGGNRGGDTKTMRNLVVTFLLGGLWHGAGWPFIIWGALHGAACAVHFAWSKRGYALTPVLGMVATFLFVNVAWVFFRAPSVTAALDVLSAMIGLAPSAVSTNHFQPFLAEAMTMILIGSVIVWGLPNSQEIAFHRGGIPRAARAIFTGVVIATVILLNNAGTPSPFLYFNF